MRLLDTVGEPGIGPHAQREAVRRGAHVFETHDDLLQYLQSK